uniref:Putative GCN5-related N-acetyltransferase n=1 Tax=mine drainage metagenome TaxID=410659 RepID=E6PML7_9ZZZZ
MMPNHEQAPLAQPDLPPDADVQVLPYFNQQGQATVPIRAIGMEHLAELRAHFLALGEDDRYLRFGYAASDTQICVYINRIDFVRDEIFGVFSRKLELIAAAHIAISCDPARPSQAEIGVSVLQSGRGKGIGTRLFQRAAMFARNRGIETLTMQCLTQNAAMMRIARRAGMEVHVAGSETEACLKVPHHSVFSHLDEWVENATGQIDFAIKLGLHRPQPA